MIATLWDSFDRMLEEAESYFLNFQYNKALETWEHYFKITAKQEYKNIVAEFRKTWDENKFTNVDSVYNLFQLLQNQKRQYTKKEISTYTYQLYRKLIIKIYKEKFRNNQDEKSSLEFGVFEYLAGNQSDAIKIFQEIIGRQPENIQARIYLGHAYFTQKDQRSAIATLSQNLVLDAIQILEDDLYLSQFKLLFGKLYSTHGNLAEASWLMAFESWYRNWLIIDEDPQFFKVIRNIETGDRIVQVKYYAWERYRHFTRCLYIAEYVRHHLKGKSGMVEEQEHYMQRLDRALFERYRKKRKGHVKLKENIE
jgi:hypothetical protein